MGYKDFVNGTALPETDLDELSKQVVLKYATAAARTADAALTTALREAMIAYLDDLNYLTIYTGSAWSTLIGSAHGALPTFTPVLNQGGVIATTSSVFWYNRVGRMVTGFGRCTANGAGVGATAVTLSLPIAADASFTTDYDSLGVGMISDASAALKYEGVVCLASTTTIKFRAAATATSPPAFLGGAGFSAALAAGDILSWNIAYPAGADG